MQEKAQANNNTSVLLYPPVNIHTNVCVLRRRAANQAWAQDHASSDAACGCPQATAAVACCPHAHRLLLVALLCRLLVCTRSIPLQLKRKGPKAQRMLVQACRNLRSAQLPDAYLLLGLLLAILILSLLSVRAHVGAVPASRARQGDFRVDQGWLYLDFTPRTQPRNATRIHCYFLKSSKERLVSTPAQRCRRCE
jgi:hypothetical protein